MYGRYHSWFIRFPTVFDRTCHLFPGKASYVESTFISLVQNGSKWNVVLSCSILKMCLAVSSAHLYLQEWPSQSGAQIRLRKMHWDNKINVPRLLLLRIPKKEGSNKFFPWKWLQPEEGVYLISINEEISWFCGKRKGWLHIYIHTYVCCETHCK